MLPDRGGERWGEGGLSYSLPYIEPGKFGPHITSEAGGFPVRTDQLLQQSSGWCHFQTLSRFQASLFEEERMGPFVLACLRGAYRPESAAPIFSRAPVG